MNVIFPIILLLSSVSLLFISPNDFLSAMSNGASESVRLTIDLLGIYLLWCGIFEILEKSGLSEKIAKILKRPIRLVFGKTDEISEKYLTMNVASNLLGIGGLATPLGIEAAKNLEKNDNSFAIIMLIVVASTSLQLLPTSVISLRQTAGSVLPSSIVIPAMLSTLVSTVCGIILTKIFVKK